jgi:hypothetical protein
MTELSAQSADIPSLTGGLASFNNVNTENINGVLYTPPCNLPVLDNSTGVYVLVDRETQEKPPNPDPLIYPEDVYDQLWDFAVQRLNVECFGMKSVLQCGRLSEKYIQDQAGCNVCPPNQLKDCYPVASEVGCGPCSVNACDVCPSGDCPGIKSYIGAIQTINPISFVKCKIQTNLNHKP